VADCLEEQVVMQQFELYLVFTMFDLIGKLEFFDSFVGQFLAEYFRGKS
jgi:hypothetical protein